MQRLSRWLFAVNKSTGHRWSPIPKPPPPNVDRLCGTHSVLNALRAFYNTAGCRHPHRRKLHCLFVRDFHLAMEDAKARADSNSSAAAEDECMREAADNKTSLQKVQERKAKGKDVWIPPQYPNLHRILRLARAMRLHVKAVERSELVRLCGERRNQNVVLELASYTPWDVVACPWHSGGRTAAANVDNVDNVLFLDHVIDPGNVGAIMRSAFFMGVRCVVLSCDSAGCTAAVARASAGLMEHMTVYRSVVPTTTFLENTIAQHKARGDSSRLEMYAAVTMPRHTAVQSRHQTDEVTESKGGGVMRRRLLLLGNEDKGLPREVVRLCSHAVHIPSLQRQSVRHTAIAQRRGEGTEEDESAADALQDDFGLLQPQEVSLNVSAASAIILAALMAGDQSVKIHRLG